MVVGLMGDKWRQLDAVGDRGLPCRGGPNRRLAIQVQRSGHTLGRQSQPKFTGVQEKSFENSGDAADDPDGWVDRHADALYRFAFAKTSRRDIAEDLVQETFVAAVRQSGSFRGESSRRTWLFAILRRKVADHFRRRSVQDSFDSTAAADQTAVVGKGTWNQDPAQLCEDAEFLDTLAGCVGKLPGHLAEAFVLRHQNGWTPAEIREVLGISATNLSMRLHRARLAIRDCLNVNWFGEGSEVSPGGARRDDETQ